MLQTDLFKSFSLRTKDIIVSIYYLYSILTYIDNNAYFLPVCKLQLRPTNVGRRCVFV